MDRIDRPEIIELEKLDLRRLYATKNEAAFLTPMIERADARLVPRTPITVEERLLAFNKMGFRPHGLYIPDDAEMRMVLRKQVEAAGQIKDVDEQLQEYFRLQSLSECWETDGIPGHWNGQQALARSKARFRLVAWGRRGGKTYYAAREGLAIALERPRTWIWIAAPTMTGVSRAFDMVIQMLDDMGMDLLVRRNNDQVKLVVLPNNSRIEGVSLDSVMSASSSNSEKKNNIAGAAIDLAIVDEAAQITREAWVRGILPPLSDRNGQAILLSSWEGETGFFYEQAQQARSRAVREGDNASWEVFQDASYNLNFFVFPQGRETPVLKDLEEDMDPVDFLEQFGAIPAGARNRVFPQFKERVHVGSYPFNRNLPVVCAVDPSGGPSPYAVAVLQDYGDYVIQIDEYYECYSSPEEASQSLSKRVWRPNVTDMIVDSAYPQDVVRWAALGWPAYAVIDKPHIKQRLSLQRIMFRDPPRFHAYYRAKMNALLATLGHEENADHNMTDAQQRELAFRLEEEMSDNNITTQDIEELRSCSRFFIHQTCAFTIDEYRTYRYKTQTNKNLSEIPQDANNHIIDATGYFVWQMKRWEIENWIQRSTSYMMPVVTIGAQPNYPQEREETDDEDQDHPAQDPYKRMKMFLTERRTAHAPGNNRVYDFVRSV